jgi:hypothetical protein
MVWVYVAIYHWGRFCQNLRTGLVVYKPTPFLFKPQKYFYFGFEWIAKFTMKKIIFSVFMLVGTFCFSQTVTKKFNSYYNRYDYYDSYSNLIGYEKYNRYSRQWEYFSLKSPQQSRQPYQYKDPQQLDISNLGNATTTLQNRYNNRRNAQTVIDDIVYQIRSMDISDSRKSNILNAFNETVKMNVRRISNGEIDWLYDASNLIIKNVTE